MRVLPTFSMSDALTKIPGDPGHNYEVPIMSFLVTYSDSFRVLVVLKD